MKKYIEEIEKYLGQVSRPQFEYAINISLKHKYIYVETPKVGCSTIKDTLQRMELDYAELIRDDFEDIHVRQLSPLLTPSQTCGFDRLLNNPDYFTFCFVRDPYTRLLSAYLDKIKKATPQKSEILSCLGQDPSDTFIDITFKQFIDVVSEQNPREMNPHWRPQYYQTFQTKIDYDFIGRMENFTSDCDTVFKKIRKDYKTFYRPEQRHATNSNELLRQYYDSKLKSIVYETFKIDFEYFGYKT